MATVIERHDAPPARAEPTVTSSRWTNLVADYRRKHTAWSSSCDAEDEATPAFLEACEALPPKPQDPGIGLPADISDMTIRQIKAAGDTPAQKAAWAEHERALAEWEKARDVIRKRVLGPAKAHHERAYTAYEKAFDRLADYRTPTLRELREKFEIIVAEYAGFEIPEEYLAAVIADLRHLGGEASA